MPPAQERRYHLSYPEVEAVPKPDHRERKYYNWKKTLRRFTTAARPAFNLSDANISEIHNIRFLEANKNVLQTINDLLLVPEFVRVVNEYYSPRNNFKTLFADRSGSLSLWVCVINSVEHYMLTTKSSRYAELSTGEHADTIARMFKDLRSTDIITRTYLLDLIMSFIELPGMIELIARDYEAHPDPNSNRLAVWTRTFNTIGSIEAYAAHPRQARVHKELSMDQLLKVYPTTFDGRFIPPIFWLNNPAMLKLVSKLIELFPNSSDIKPGDKRLIFQLLMSSLGRHGVTEVELLAETFAHWQPNPDEYLKRPRNFQTEGRQLSTEDEFYFYLMENITRQGEAAQLDELKYTALDMLSAGAQREFLSRVKSADPIKYPQGVTGLEAPGLQAMRRRVRQRKGIAESLAAKELLPDAEKTNWLEDPFHPLNPYMSLGGFEIEANFPAEMKDKEMAPHLFRVVGQFGYRNGKDIPTELSPDPCIRPETVVGQFNDYIDAGLLDVHAETTQAGHLNIEVLSPAHMAVLFRMSYLTGRGVHPVFPKETAQASPSDLENAVQRLSIHAKMSEAQHKVPPERMYYTEGKGYRVTTPADFSEVIRSSMILGSAARVYEASWCVLKSTTPAQYRKDQEAPLTSYEIRLGHSDIDKVQDPTARRLSRVWLNFLNEATALTENPNVKLPNFLKTTVPQPYVTKLGRSVREVFPTPYHHDDEVALMKRSSFHQPIQYDGQSFPNVVVAFRHLSEKYVQKVLDVYRKHLEKFRKELRPVFALEPGPEQDALRDQTLLKLYPGKSIGNLSATERQQLLEKLKFRLFDDPQLAEYDYNVPR